MFLSAESLISWIKLPLGIFDTFTCNFSFIFLTRCPSLSSEPRLLWLRSHKLSVWPPFRSVFSVDCWNAQRFEPGSWQIWCKFVLKTTTRTLNAIIYLKRSFAPLLHLPAKQSGSSSGFLCLVLFVTLWLAEAGQVISSLQPSVARFAEITWVQKWKIDFSVK